MSERVERARIMPSVSAREGSGDLNKFDMARPTDEITQPNRRRHGSQAWSWSDEGHNLRRDPPSGVFRVGIISS